MSKFGKIFLVVFGLVWCSITFIIDGGLAWNLVQQLRASNFPTVMGTVTYSKVNVTSDGEGNSYHADVRYRYVVDGQTYESTSIRFDQMSSFKEQTEAQVRKYGVDQAVTVYYNPAQPQTAVLELGPSIDNFYAALGLAPFNAVAFFLIGGLWSRWRTRQLGRPVAGVSLRSDGLITTVRLYERSPTFAAVANFGGFGFLTLFGVTLAMWLMPLEAALALGWSAVLAVTFLAWRSARKKYAEIGVDTLRGRVDIRDYDGRTYSLDREDIQQVSYSSRTNTNSEGTKTTYPLGLSYLDPESQKPCLLALPEQSSAEDAEFIAHWLNGLLHLRHTGTEARAL
jgi:hypothetical protein